MTGGSKTNIMSTTKQFSGTPGPWEFIKCDSETDIGNFIGTVRQSEGWLFDVAEIHDDSDEKEKFANAQLIAAAPDLLEALQEIRSWYEGNGDKYLGECTPVCFSKGLSAINKALGNE